VHVVDAASDTVKVLPPTVRVAVRVAVPVLPATLKLADPLPEPLPVPIVTHEALLEADHAHPAAVVTATVPEPPAFVNDWLVGEMLNAQLGAAAWVTVNVWPATVSVADRVEVEVFAAAVKLTVPLPEPLDPAVTVTHPALLAAVHEQPAAAVTATLPEPPAATKPWDAGERLNVQLAAACVTLNVCPATVSVAERAEVVVFAAAANVTVPLPLPVAPAEIVTQPALLAAVHAQPAVVVTSTVPDPPAAANDWLAGDRLNEQAAPACVTVNVLPATVNVPVRWVVAVVAATVKPTDPVPVPLPPAVMVSHPALLVADQPHPAPAVTPTLPLPPAAANDRDTGEIAGAHGAVKANVLDGTLGLVPPGPTADTRVS
jgi:hypothetical protein